MAAVRDALVASTGTTADGWLAARGGAVAPGAQRAAPPVGRRGPAVLEHPDVDEVRAGLKRLLVDIYRHVQRLHDLAYDEVELEIGGSE